MMVTDHLSPLGLAQRQDAAGAVGLLGGQGDHIDLDLGTVRRIVDGAGTYFGGLLRKDGAPGVECESPAQRFEMGTDDLGEEGLAGGCPDLLGPMKLAIPPLVVCPPAMADSTEW